MLKWLDDKFYGPKKKRSPAANAMSIGLFYARQSTMGAEDTRFPAIGQSPVSALALAVMDELDMPWQCRVLFITSTTSTIGDVATIMFLNYS